MVGESDGLLEALGCRWRCPLLLQPPNVGIGGRLQNGVQADILCLGPSNKATEIKASDPERTCRLVCQSVAQ
eukprot:4888191-Amphidinium_carterae.1